jgi:subtilisin family serine protease
MERAPGWSSAFAKDAIRHVVGALPEGEISRDWAWEGSTGAGVKVAVIDSGVDPTHPAVGAVNGYVTITDHDGRIEVTSDHHEDDYGHGTACAGIIRAVAPDCEIYSVKVLGANLLGQGLVFAAGLKWAIENQMQVCNLSLGTTKRDFFALLHELADLAYFRNVTLVTAANNMTLPSFPSVYASVISVASHDTEDPYLFYYNPSPPVEFGAPGIDVRVPWLKGQWITGTGNSYAAPHISGIVAKILAKHPGLSVFQIKTILQALSANVGGDAPQPVPRRLRPLRGPAGRG